MDAREFRCPQAHSKSREDLGPGLQALAQVSRLLRSCRHGRRHCAACWVLS